jgi:hypothetical protein
MFRYDDTAFILVKDKDGEKFLCPLNSSPSVSSKSIELNDDCIEADVVGRYAGNIIVASSS